MFRMNSNRFWIHFLCAATFLCLSSLANSSDRSRNETLRTILRVEILKHFPGARIEILGAPKLVRGDSLDAVLAKLGKHELRPMGSALKICLVADGTADFYPRLGPTSEWDTAAAQAVLEIAGGAVTTTAGEPLRYNQRDTILNPHFLAFGDRSRRWSALFD